MPICIECRYPVAQLCHFSHSSKQHPSSASAATTPTPSGTAAPTSGSSSHHHNKSGNAQPGGAAAGANSTAGSVGGSFVGGEAKRSGGGTDVRLTQCPRCRRFADKYVEHDFVVLFIDLVLVKPQVYRHLLFNRLGRDDDALDPSILRLGTFLLLFDVYLTWSRIEELPPQLTSRSRIPQLPDLIQYAFYLFLCAFTTLAQHFTIRTLTKSLIAAGVIAAAPAPPPGAIYSGGTYTPSASAMHTPSLSHGRNTSAGSAAADPSQSYFTYHHHNSNHSHASHSQQPSFSGPHSSYPLPPSPPKPSAISTALLVSSCMKLFPILMFVWRYNDAGGQLARGVGWAVAAQNVEALRILLGTRYWSAAALVASGEVSRWAARRVVLWAVGLGAVDGG